mmetsp:Transcript_14955/g.58586  ORF Transcript_14955/g.58586 Transcript_14955/m.58586 type:complete len:222 (-) Transcript_14955:1958-2623(-)
MSAHPVASASRLRAALARPLRQAGFLSALAVDPPRTGGIPAHRVQSEWAQDTSTAMTQALRGSLSRLSRTTSPCPPRPTSRPTRTTAQRTLLALPPRCSRSTLCGKAGWRQWSAGLWGRILPPPTALVHWSTQQQQQQGPTGPTCPRSPRSPTVLLLLSRTWRFHNLAGARQISCPGTISALCRSRANGPPALPTWPRLGGVSHSPGSSSTRRRRSAHPLL